MRVLVLCSRIPFPPDDGGSIAMVQLQKGLAAAGIATEVMAFNTSKHFISPERIDSTYAQTTKLEAIFLDNRVKPLPALINLLLGRSYHISRFDLPDFHHQLSDRLRKTPYDFVIIEGLSMAPYLSTIRAHSTAKVILRAHNVEHVIWKKLARKGQNPFRNWYLNTLSRQLEQFEVGILRNVDGIVAIADPDANELGKMAPNTPICTVPTALDSAESSRTRKGQQLVIAHLGAMDWMPNQEGVEWFLSKIWPSVSEQRPGTLLRLAGKHMPKSIQNQQRPGLEVTGFVNDAHAFLSEADILIVPLLSGSGMRIKLAEGLAMGKAIVSTHQGSEGIPVIHEEHLLLADSPEQFIDALVRLIDQPDFREKLGNSALSFARNHFSVESSTRILLDFLSNRLKNHPDL